MPHLHLSLQAGDDMILKRMKRRHSRADAHAIVCARLRRGAARHRVRRRPDRRIPDGDRGDVRELACGWSRSAASPSCTSSPIRRARARRRRACRNCRCAERKERAARLRAAGDAARRRFFGRISAASGLRSYRARDGQRHRPLRALRAGSPADAASHGTVARSRASSRRHRQRTDRAGSAVCTMTDRHPLRCPRRKRGPRIARRPATLDPRFRAA